MASCLARSEAKRRSGISERRGARTLAIAVLLVLTAEAAVAAGAASAPLLAESPPPPEPWSVEAPGGAGAPVGLGLDFLVEKQVSLTIDSARTAVTTRDLERGITSTQVLNGDPNLLNRKFGIGWETHGAGAQVPLALPCVPFGPGGWGITPTLVLQAADVDLNLAFHDLPEPRASTSLHGRGLQLGAALDLVAPLWPGSSWYAGGGYRYCFFPRLAVDRGQPVVEPEAQVLPSDVRLRRTVGEASLRLGHVFGGDRAAVYLGAMRRRSRITVDDDLVLLEGAIQQQTRLLSRTGFASTATAAVGGLDIHLAGPFFARAEVTFGAGDSTVLGKLVVVPAWRPWFAGTALRRQAAKEDQPGGEVPREPAAREIQQRARQIADQIAPRLAEIRARFAREAAILEEQSAPAAADVARLLDSTEREVLDVIDAPELAALRDAVSEFFAKARAALGLERAAAFPAGSRPGVHAAGGAEGAVRALLAPGAIWGGVRAAAQRTSLHPAAVRTSLARTDADLEKLATQAAYRDLVVNLCVKSGQQRLRFDMHAKSRPDSKYGASTDHRMRSVWRGVYTYAVKPPPHFKGIHSELDLFHDSGPIVRCNLVADTNDADALPCDLESGDIDKECPH